MAATDYDFLNTRNEIIERAHRKIGALGLGEVLSANQITHGVDALNQIIKNWQTIHTFPWTLKMISQALTESTASYVLSSDPPILAVERAYLRDGNNVDMPLNLISWRDYNDISDKTLDGQPIAVAFDHQAAPNLYIYPRPNATYAAYTIYLLAVTKLGDWDSASGTEDFPAKWQQAIIHALAADLADDYGLPMGERDRLAGKADLLFRRAKASDGDQEELTFVKGAFS